MRDEGKSEGRTGQGCMTIEGEGERWLSIIAGSHLDLLENLSHLVPNRLKKTFTDYHL